MSKFLLMAEELGCLAHHLNGMTAYTWDESQHVPYEERCLLGAGTRIHSNVLAIGRMANRIDGFDGMQFVMRMAFHDAFSDVPLGDGSNRNRHTLAASELNSVWHGIG